MALVKRSKYKNVKVTLFGITFDSKAEGDRYLVLREMLNKGVITDLKLQEVYELIPSVVINGRKKPALRYKSDFSYLRDGVKITEDVKGVLTDVYKIKRHLMKSIHGIDILETK